MGIRGILALGLAGLLAVSGLIAGMLVFTLVGDEAERAVASQQRLRAAALTRMLEAQCSTQALCQKALQRLQQTEPARGSDLMHLALLAPGPTPVFAERLNRRDRDSVVIDALQSRALAWSREDIAGQPVLRVAVPLRLPSGMRGVLNATFELASARASLARRQKLVLWSLILDFAGVLVFGIYLGGRYIVRPIQGITEAAALVTMTGAHSTLTMPQDGPREINRLARTFEQMVRRLGEQQDTLRRQVSALETARNELVRSEKLATVGRLASGVAHEVGNPLAAVIGFVEFMQDPRGVSPDQQADLLTRMQRELGRIQTTIRDLLDFSRPSAGVPEPVDLMEAAQSAYELVRYQRRFKSIEVVFEAESLPPVIVDRGRLRQVLVNLLLNAADALATVETGTRLITIGAAAHSREGISGVRLTVSDNGPGVPEDIAEQLFDPFFTTKQPGEGTGLGLAIAHRLVEEAQGHLALQTSDAGAAFSVWLPT
ncbi:MAG: sensor histidine kinase [Bradymonadia bacterium]